MLVPAFRNVSVFYEAGTLSQPVYLRPLAVPTVFLDHSGQQLYTLGNGQFRSPVTLSQVPEMAIRAILDVEDHTFYQHGAIDLRSIARAVVVDATGGAGLQGGSTITQQLVKQEVLTPQRTLSRKIKEVFIAFRLAHQLSKNQILQDYLNHTELTLFRRLQLSILVHLSARSAGRAE